jgi:hypothetical protein
MEDFGQQQILTPVLIRLESVHHNGDAAGNADGLTSLAYIGSMNGAFLELICQSPLPPGRPLAGIPVRIFLFPFFNSPDS